MAEAMSECPFDSIDDIFPMEISFQLGSKSSTIHSSSYERVDIHDVALQQTHLSDAMRSDLEQLLLQHPKLFSRKLGCYLHSKVHLDLKPDATPSRCRPYPVP
jgi:hypothetical protein